MPFYAPSIFALGIVSRQQGRYAEAESLLAEALASFQKARETLNVAATLDELGRLHLASGQVPQAVSVLLESLKIKERLGSRYGIAATLALLGSADEQQGQLDAAQAVFARAVEELEAAGSQVADATQVGALQGSLPRLYAQYARVLVRQGRPEAALLTVERGRAQGLLRQVTTDPARFMAALPPQERERLRRGAQEARAASRLLQAIQEQPEPLAPAEYTDYRQQLEDAISRSRAAEFGYKLLRDTLTSHSPTLARQTLPRLTHGQLQALARRTPDTLYLVWAVVDEANTLLFAMSHAAGVRPVLLPVGHRKLVALVGAWREALAALAETRVDKRAEAFALVNTEVERSTEISRALLSAPELAELLTRDFQRLVIAPDDALLEIPFAALIGPDGERLIKRYAVSAAISLSLLARRRRARKPKGSLLCVADPLRTAVSVSGTRLPEDKVEKKADWTVLRPEEPEVALRRSKSELEAAREEGIRIAALFPQSKMLVGPDADEATVRHLMPSYALLHFATHGVLNARSGLRSALVLAPKQETLGMLEARDIMDLRLCAELAVLSACDSGLGQRIVGEGVLGFAWAFYAAGCASVVTSLWQVRDRSTAQMMEQFYTSLAAGQPKDVALQRAMIGTMGMERYNHPYYWATFQLIGDATPVSIQTSIQSTCIQST